jgi:hypothetical protein
LGLSTFCFFSLEVFEDAFTLASEAAGASLFLGASFCLRSCSIRSSMEVSSFLALMYSG